MNLCTVTQECKDESLHSSQVPGTLIAPAQNIKKIRRRAVYAAGKRMRNALPWPSVLSTVMSP